MRIIRLSLYFIFSLTIVIWASEYDGKAKVAFKGSSTLHDFEGHTEGTIKGKISNTSSYHFESEVKVEQIDTDNSSRNKKMYNMFEHSKFPKILINADFDEKQKEAMTLMLTIKEKTLPIVAKVSNFSNKQGKVGFDISFDISLKEFGLTPPTTMMGMVKVGDKVETSVHVELNEVKP